MSRTRKEVNYFFRKFDPEVLLATKFCRLAFIGKTNSGKSEAVKTLCHFYKDKCFGGFAHSCSEREQRFFREFIPPSFIYWEKDLKRLQQVYDAQKARVRMFQDLIRKNQISKEEAQKRSHLLIILDDMMFMGDQIFKNDLIKEVWMNGRHAWITVFITLQYGKGIGPALRDQIDWVFLWQEASVNAQKKLFEDWVGYFESLPEFKLAFNDLTGEYKCMVVKKIAGGKTDVESNVFFWKPQLITKPFKIGVKEYRLFDVELRKEYKKKRERERENKVMFMHVTHRKGT